MINVSVTRPRPPSPRWTPWRRWSRSSRRWRRPSCCGCPPCRRTPAGSGQSPTRGTGSRTSLVAWTELPGKKYLNNTTWTWHFTRAPHLQVSQGNVDGPGYGAVVEQLLGVPDVHHHGGLVLQDVEQLVVADILHLAAVDPCCGQTQARTLSCTQCRRGQGGLGGWWWRHKLCTSPSPRLWTPWCRQTSQCKTWHLIWCEKTWMLALFLLLFVKALKCWESAVYIAFLS